MENDLLPFHLVPRRKESRKKTKRIKRRAQSMKCTICAALLRLLNLQFIHELQLHSHQLPQSERESFSIVDGHAQTFGTLTLDIIAGKIFNCKYTSII